MPNPRYVVRIVKRCVIKRDTIPDALADCLSRAGLWQNHDLLVDIFVHGDNQAEATRLADHMSSFGYNAVCAPKWEG